MNRKRTPRFFALLVLIGLVCLMVTPTGAKGPEAIPIVDSKIIAQPFSLHLEWLNDDHVVILTNQRHPYLNTLFLWNTVGNTITKYLKVDEGLGFCVHDGVLTQLRQKDQHITVVTGPPGAERTTVLQKKHGCSIASAASMPTSDRLGLRNQRSCHSGKNTGIWISAQAQVCR
jgi:hypothetical protein